MSNFEFAASLSGAVDLSALANKPNPAESQLSSDVASSQIISSPLAQDIDTNNLQSFFELSLHVPLIIGFHSPHSPNSQQLREKLIDLVGEYQGRIGVGFLSTDDEPQIAAMFEVRGVPAMVAVVQGQPIPLVQGLPSDAELKQLFEQLLAAAKQSGMQGVLSGEGDLADSQEPELPPLHQEALAALETGDLDTAHAKYSQAVKENSHDFEALSAMRQIELMQRIALLNPERSPERSNEILHIARDAGLGDFEKQLEAADIEVAFGRPDAAFARLIDTVREHNGEARDTVRKRLLEYFEALGATSELVIQARKALTNALF